MFYHSVTFNNQQAMEEILGGVSWKDDILPSGEYIRVGEDSPSYWLAQFNTEKRLNRQERTEIVGNGHSGYRASTFNITALDQAELPKQILFEDIVAAMKDTRDRIKNIKADLGRDPGACVHLCIDDGGRWFFAPNVGTLVSPDDSTCDEDGCYSWQLPVVTPYMVDYDIHIIARRWANEDFTGEHQFPPIRVVDEQNGEGEEQIAHVEVIELL